ncbi:tetrameric potassium-selective cyclic nucleotide gated channel [Danaus plexippus plexippus]|uniref:Tetrameric potassium-selective cyclic nucleotide gated channel n=1 Tax=Danaus plexippus plexippus TaxID=278856 RepID=A0A212EMU7_DANPL|nr:tetrameric potassium-selective cyclic nucleotide gated channel [Danaus plexippus plexippus]
MADTSKKSIFKDTTSVHMNVDVENQQREQEEDEYGFYYSIDCFNKCLFSLHDNVMWNAILCFLAVAAIVVVSIEFKSTLSELFEVVYNVFYAVHVLSLAYNSLANLHTSDLGLCTARALSDYNLKGSIVATTLKYTYFFMILRVSWVLIWLHFDTLESDNSIQLGKTRYHIPTKHEPKLTSQMPSRFLSTYYIINKMFIPIGPSIPPRNDLERIAFLSVMIVGCLMVTGAAVASLSLVISIYMRPEEKFRSRYRLIMKEMQEPTIPPNLREKVETFYKMYWHKQKAVSTAELMPIFPPSLSSTIYTDIYFKATQKCRILRDLSYQFLSELAKLTETIHYIPGDQIIRRNNRKSSIIYITYGDIELLTAEDDTTALLRMIRGTAVSSCAGVPACCGRAHVQIRAATFCTAHVLDAAQIWRAVHKYGRRSGQGNKILNAFNEHFEKVKRHYNMRDRGEVKHKSSILHFKRNLMDLKESRDAAGNLLLAETDVMIEIAGCYVMRNRADASLTDEADAICLRPTFPCILQPRSSLQVAWNVFVTTVIITVCITHPYFLVYKKTVPTEFRFYDYVVTFIYILDLVVHLSTGANVEDGVPITLAQTSSQQAQSKLFVLDVIATLPLLEFIGDGHFAGLNKLLRLPKVFRVLKIVEEECVYHSNIVRFCSYALLLLSACYLLAALQQGFMCFQFGYCLVTNFTHSPYWEKQPLDTETVPHRLTFGLYWAISVITFTAHMETWGIDDWRHVLYTLIVLEICVILYIFIEAVYSATIMVTSDLREDYDASIESVTKFLLRKDIDPVLRQRFVDYLQLCWFTDKAYSITNNESSIFYDLPPHVYQDIVSRQRSKYVLSLPFMKWLHKEDLKTISSKARLFCTAPNEILLNTGDMCNEIYVITRGICEILNPDTKGVVGELGAKCHFGVLECLLSANTFEHRIPAFYTVRAVTNVEMFKISRKHLINAIDVPQIRDAIDFSKERPEYHRLQIRRAPFTSYRPPDSPPNMERFRLPRKYERDYAFLHPFDRLGLLSFLRYIFPRFTLRPDGRYLVRYEWIRATSALLSALVFPPYTYLVLQFPWLYLVALLLDLSAYFDILQRMLVGYYNDEGILIYHPSSTAAHYVKGAFFIDLFGCLPLERLESSWKQSYQNRYRETPTKQFLMLNRLLQLYRMPAAQLGLASFIRRDILLVIKSLPLFLALLNVLTSFFVYSSVNIYYTVETNEWFIIPLPDPGGSWLHLFKTAYRFNVTESPWNLHLGSYFWVVYETTTTGYGNFKPTNFNLIRVLIAGMMIGALITTYFSVRIISIRANVNKALAAFQEDMIDISAFMSREKLDSNLQKQVLAHYQYNWERMGGIDYRNVLKMCQQITLRTDTILQIYGQTFTMCPILNKCDVSLLRLIGRAVRTTYFLNNTTIIEKEDVISDIFFVDLGSVDLEEQKAETSVTLEKGSMFGNLTSRNTYRCPDIVRSHEDVRLLQINAQTFFSIIADFPTVHDQLQMYRSNNESYIVGVETIIPRTKANLSLASSVPTNQRRYFRFLHIRQSIARMYLIVISLACIYADIYNAGFQDNRPLLIMSLYLLDFCFMWKFVLQYFIPQMTDVDDGALGTYMKVRLLYFKQEFKYDLISFLPIEILCLFCKNNRGMVFSWLRLNRLFRIVTLYKCLNHHHERISANLTLATAGSVLIWFTIFIHGSVSLWFFIGTLEENAAEKSSWSYGDDGVSWCNNNYICSLYFILTTFTQTGVGDILPKKQSEVLFVSGFQIISTMMCMVYVGELSNIIQYNSYRSFNFYANYLQLQEFLKNNRVSKNLVTIVNKYCLHLWRESRGLQIPCLLRTAPDCLKLQVMGAAYLKHLTEKDIFKACEPAFLRQLVGFLQLYSYTEDMYVVKEDEITNSMYFVHLGKVLETSKNSNIVKSYHPGECFGELQGLEQDLPYTKSYKTVMKSQILSLHLNDLKYLLAHFPLSKNTIYKSDESDAPPTDRGDDRSDGSFKVKPQTSYDKSPKTDTPPIIHSDIGQGKEMTEADFEELDTEWHTNTRIRSLDEGNVTDLEVEKDTVPYEETKGEGSAEDVTRQEEKTYRDDFKSVEDYIESKHGSYIMIPKENYKTASAGTSGLKRRKTHVWYQEKEAASPSTETRELKPIRDQSIDERNSKTFDSDSPFNIKESTSSQESIDKFKNQKRRNEQ